VAEAAYAVTDTSIDPQINKLKASGADIFFDVTTPKFAAKGDPAGGRTRLEAGAHHPDRVGIGRRRAGAGGIAECRRPAFGGLHVGGG